MNRSEINKIIDGAIAFTAKMNFLLPPFAYWTPDELRSKGNEYREIFDNKLGWDITDFGSDDFFRTGLTLITIRNGNNGNPQYHKPYAEKILIVEEGQVTPYHYHALKMEDIINRGGGTLIVNAYNSVNERKTADTDVLINMDGRSFMVKAGAEIKVRPGESITLFPKVFHTFRAEKGLGRILLGEVSKVNDDYTDNYFLEKAGRFPEITEDEPARHLLCSEY